MIEKSIGLISNGDILGKDYTFYNLTDSKTFNHGITLNKGAKLTTKLIQKLKSDFHVSSLWIDDNTDIPISDTEYSPKEKINSTVIFMTAVNNIMDSKIIAWEQIQQMVETMMQSIMSIIYSKKSMETVKSYFDFLGDYDFYTFEHSVNTAIYASTVICKLNELGYIKHTQANIAPTSDEILRMIIYNMLLHDLGKLRIPLEILNKPGALTPVEYEKMKMHPHYGIELLRTMDEKLSELGQNPIPSNYKIACLQHHENKDGTGYPNIKIIGEDNPRPLKGNEIHIFGRIGRIVDIYDALTTSRPYRKPYHPLDVLKYMEKFTDKWIDGRIFDVFKTQINPFPIGNSLKLKTGELAVITGYKDGDKFKPIVKPYYKEIYKNGRKESMRIKSETEIAIDESDGENKFTRDENIYEANPPV